MLKITHPCRFLLPLDLACRADLQWGSNALSVSWATEEICNLSNKKKKRKKKVTEDCLKTVSHSEKIYLSLSHLFFYSYIFYLGSTSSCESSRKCSFRESRRQRTYVSWIIAQTRKKLCQANVICLSFLKDGKSDKEKMRCLCMSIIPTSLSQI